MTSHLTSTNWLRVRGPPSALRASPAPLTSATGHRRQTIGTHKYRKKSHDPAGNPVRFARPRGHKILTIAAAVLTAILIVPGAVGGNLMTVIFTFLLVPALCLVRAYRVRSGRRWLVAAVLLSLAVLAAAVSPRSWTVVSTRGWAYWSRPTTESVLPGAKVNGGSAAKNAGSRLKGSLLKRNQGLVCRPRKPGRDGNARAAAYAGLDPWNTAACARYALGWCLS